MNSTVPSAVDYLTGTFTRIDEKAYGLLAPLYLNQKKGLFLFSHHPRGRVWQVSTKLSTTPLRGVFDLRAGACPDSDGPDGGSVQWEWFNTTTPEGQQLYVRDSHVRVKCLDGHHGA